MRYVIFNVYLPLWFLSVFFEQLCAIAVTQSFTENFTKFHKEKPMPIIYKEVKLDYGYRIDLLIEEKVVVEIKTVEDFTDVRLA